MRPPKRWGSMGETEWEGLACDALGVPMNRLAGYLSSESLRHEEEEGSECEDRHGGAPPSCGPPSSPPPRFGRRAGLIRWGEYGLRWERTQQKQGRGEAEANGGRIGREAAHAEETGRGATGVAQRGRWRRDRKVPEGKEGASRRTIDWKSKRDSCYSWCGLLCCSRFARVVIYTRLISALPRMANGPVHVFICIWTASRERSTN
jgi:hypothetical protein